MEIEKKLFDLLSQFNSNWEEYQSDLSVTLSENEISSIDTHPLVGELVNLINGKGGSLPYFGFNRPVTWCTLAPNSLQLQQLVEALQAWILPSFGWQDSSDGYLTSVGSVDPFRQAIFKVSPSNYFKWQCERKYYSEVVKKLYTRYILEKNRPERSRVRHLSLYEFRAQFQTALTLGDRALAEKTIDLIDAHELDKALNTQMMRIRLWYSFREFEHIKNYRNLSSLLIYPSLPNVIEGYIKEAIGDVNQKQEPIEESAKPSEDGFTNEWMRWFELLVDQHDVQNAQSWLEEKGTILIEELTNAQIVNYSEGWDAIYVNNELKEQHKPLVSEALVSFLGDFVREPEFPRNNFSDLYLSLLRLWGEMHAGIGRGREEGHVLLELANALFELNHEIDEVMATIEGWWRARPAPSQLPFALDGIELLTLHHPNSDSAVNIWIDAADQAKRNPQQLMESEKILWRSAGTRIGLGEETIDEYFPINQDAVHVDPIISSGIKSIAIVCMREQQARLAAEMIRERSGAAVSIVSKKVAGAQTTQALSCDVVLFVWMATTHAVFRAFDDFDRQKLCYVQGTGPASIVRTLERWVIERIDETTVDPL